MVILFCALARFFVVFPISVVRVAVETRLDALAVPLAFEPVSRQIVFGMYRLLGSHVV